MKEVKKVKKDYHLLFVVFSLACILVIGILSIWAYDFFGKISLQKAAVDEKITETMEERLAPAKSEETKVIIREDIPDNLVDSEELKEAFDHLKLQNGLNKSEVDAIQKQMEQKFSQQLEQQGQNQGQITEYFTLKLHELSLLLQKLEKESVSTLETERIRELINSLEEGMVTPGDLAKLTDKINKLEEYLIGLKKDSQDSLASSNESLKEQLIVRLEEVRSQTEQKLIELLGIMESEDNQLRAMIGDLTELQTTNKENLTASVNELFQSVSEGKKKVASAITDKGITTDASASFEVMSQNIRGLITMSSNPNVLFNVTSWTAPEDCIAVMSFSVSMLANCNDPQVATATLHGVRSFSFEWGDNSSSDTSHHNYGTSGNVTWEAKKGQTYWLSFDPGCEHYLTWGWGPITWIVPHNSKVKSRSVPPDYFFDKITDISIDEIQEHTQEAIKPQTETASKDQDSESQKIERPEQTKEQIQEQTKEQTKEQTQEQTKEQTQEQTKEQIQEQTKEQTQEQTKEQTQEQIQEQTKAQIQEQTKAQTQKRIH